MPGRSGNVVLAAHNDIYGEIFRRLDQLERGDEILISTERTTYTYVVRETEIVQPTDTWVMGPTEHASTTLISCYPYLVDNKRIVVFADLASETRWKTSPVPTNALPETTTQSFQNAAVLIASSTVQEYSSSV